MTTPVTIDGNVLKQIMRGWVAGVTVVTSVGTGDQAAERSGMTVSSFTSVSVDPASILVCLNRDTHTHDLALQSRILGITILAHGQDHISATFAGQIPELKAHAARLASVETFTLTSAAPLIAGGLGWLDCRVTAAHDASTHTIFVADVIDLRVNSDSPAPLVYFNRGYRQLV